MRLERAVDWPQRLSEKMLQAQPLAHEWGSNDCVIFCADCVEAMTGLDPIEDVRGRWTSKIGAARVIKSAGFESLGEMAADRLNEIPVSECKRGDVVLCDGEAGEFLAIVIAHYCVAPGPYGLAQIPLSQAQKGFAV
jgi:hypothetical protein